MKHINIDILIFIVIIGLIILSFKDWSADKETDTREIMNQFSEQLDRKVKPSGDSTKRKSNTIAEAKKDAWGTPLQVDYKNDGDAQLLLVKSAGKDKLWKTEDDLVIAKKQPNAKGTGEGRKEVVPQTNVPTKRIKKTSSAVKKKVIGSTNSVTYNLLATEQSTN